MTVPRRRPVAGLVLAAVLATAAALAAQATSVLDGPEHRAVATRFALRGSATPDDVVLVAIDDVSFSDLRQQWPFPRSLHARMIDRLRAAGARQIVYDVQFTEPTERAEDAALYDALGRSSGVVLATSEFDDRGRTNVLGGDDNLAPVHSRAAAANLAEGFGGSLDRFPYAAGRLRSLAVVTAERVGGRRVPRSAFANRGAWIDFRGPPGAIKTVSFSDVLRRRLDPGLLRGRIVVVGATAPSLQDRHPTPTASEPMSGPEVQANAIWTALHGLPLRDAPLPVDLALLLLMGSAIPLLRLRLRVLPAALVAPVVAAAFAAGAQIAFAGGTVVWVAGPLAALAVGTVAMIVASHLAESALRRRVARRNDALEAKVRERTGQLRRTQLEILQRLSRAAEWRDQTTGQHLHRIGRLCEGLGTALGMSPAEAETLRHAAIAHDIGKIAVPDDILQKPGPLTADERAEMQHHALIGASMLRGSESEVMQLAELVARTHHERWDGEGYPAGLTGEAIPLAGRICAVCDVFDALVSERPYKRAWSLDEAIHEIHDLRGAQFDPAVADAFLAVAPALHAELYDPTSGQAPQSKTSSEDADAPYAAQAAGR